MPDANRLTAEALRRMKGRQKIVALTAYDYQTARLLDEGGVDLILVGDSLGNVIFGREHTLTVRLEEILHHTRAVAPACRRALVAADLPFLSYQPCDADAVRSAGRLLAEGGAAAVKLEGGTEMTPRVRAIVDSGIPVIGHVGLTPQAIHRFGRYRMTGKEGAEREKIRRDALALEEAGAFALVLECVEERLAREITAAAAIPTIGIGSGAGVDGQILVVNDLIGLNTGAVPKFVQPQGDAAAVIRGAVARFAARVREE